MARSISLHRPRPEKAARRDPRLVSYNIEMAEVTGGTFWKPYTPLQVSGAEEFPVADLGTGGGSFSMADALGATSALMAPRAPIDLESPRLRKLAAAIGPSWVRVSGSWATGTYFDFDGRTGGTPPAGYRAVLTRAQWEGVLRFVRSVDGRLLTSFALNPSLDNAACRELGGTGAWDPAQIRRLLNFSMRHGTPVAAVELANEPNISFLDAPAYTAEAYARDQDAFFHFMRIEFPDVLLAGPCCAMDPIGLDDLVEASNSWLSEHAEQTDGDAKPNAVQGGDAVDAGKVTDEAGAGAGASTAADEADDEGAGEPPASDPSASDSSASDSLPEGETHAPDEDGRGAGTEAAIAAASPSASFAAAAGAAEPSAPAPAPGAPAPSLFERLAERIPTSERIAKAARQEPDAYSYHIYAGMSERGAAFGHHWPAELAASDFVLDVADRARRYHERVRDDWCPSAPLWVTESGDANCGGNTWGSTFLDVFRTADELGRFSSAADGAIFHNTLASSDYGLLDEEDFSPRPNWWFLWLWTRLMGDVAYAASDATVEPLTPEGAHAYVRSRADGAPGLAYLVVNNALDDELVLQTSAPATVYILSSATAPAQGAVSTQQLRSAIALLNGTPLQLGTNDALPALEPLAMHATAGRITLQPGTVAFLVS